ncbi:hypothetical protein ACJRO7_018191 [Eucalyptus globulus]|uniref:Secreted protein n=1 Tax=Eucalyptus globulus TaxID=34317 RepID=A0ABD3KU01_EUCGL
MKGPPSALMASVLAASTAALTSGRAPLLSSSSSGSSEARAGARSSTEDKFAPRFERSKFIETLVIAHR